MIGFIFTALIFTVIGWIVLPQPEWAASVRRKIQKEIRDVWNAIMDRFDTDGTNL